MIRDWNMYAHIECIISEKPIWAWILQSILFNMFHTDTYIHRIPCYALAEKTERESPLLSRGPIPPANTPHSPLSDLDLQPEQRRIARGSDHSNFIDDTLLTISSLQDETRYGGETYRRRAVIPLRVRSAKLRRLRASVGTGKSPARGQEDHLPRTSLCFVRVGFVNNVNTNGRGLFGLSLVGFRYLGAHDVSVGKRVCQMVGIFLEGLPTST